MIPAHLCCTILDGYAWIGALFGALSTVTIYTQQPTVTIANPFFAAYAAMALLQLAVAILRGVPFLVRTVALVIALVANATIASVTVGIGPNWFFLILMAVSMVALFFGPRAGPAALVIVGALFGLVALGWIGGRFPVGISLELTRDYLDFRLPSVWTRVLLGTGVCVAGLMIVAGKILRSLNEALTQSTTALQTLASEQEQRTQAVEALRASEERFSKVFRFSPDAISVVDLETGRYLDVNEGFERLFGYTRAEMVGRTDAEIGHWVRAEELEQMTGQVRQHGTVRDFQAFGRRKDGAVRIFRVSAERVEIAGREALVFAARDITGRLQAEQSLRESEAKFSKVFRASPIAILITDFDTGRIADGNEAFLRTYECTRDQIIGRTTLELGLWIDPTDRERVASRLRDGRGIRNFKVRERTVAGRLITVLMSCEWIELGEQMSILTMVQDITDRELAEAALRESEEKFSRVFHSGPDAMAIVEFETGRYLEVNGGFERLFGYTRAEAIGRTSLDLGIWRSTAEREGFLTRLQTEGAVRELEIESGNRRGERLTYLVSAEPMMLGGRRCIVSATHDITDRKRAEGERASAIAREVQARQDFTRRLIAAQEAERRRIAGELHDSLGQNLLLMKNRAQLALADDALPPELRWQFENIHDMAAQAIAEVRQISHDLRPYQLDQLGLTRALESMIDGAARSTGFPFERRIEQVDDVFSGEAATHFYRIVQECLNNVLKHARARHARILLERDIHHVRLWIEDDGCGFVADAPAADGGGLGLKNMSERARILGGTVRIESSPGQGTRCELLVMLPEADGRI